MNASNQNQAVEMQNTYEARIEEKKERYKLRAAAAMQVSTALSERARSLVSGIPMGQPILVGHHSKGRDRRYREKIGNTYRQSFEAQEKAKYYENKAKTVGTGGISGDDPDAIKKLREQLETAEQRQERMKTANKIIRQSKTPAAQLSKLIEAGFSEAEALRVMTPDCYGHVGFARFSLTNNNANITRIKKRISDLEKLAQRVDCEKSGDGFIYREDTTELRVMFIFDGKPDDDTRSFMKRNGFKWSPRRGAWVRQLNNAGIWAGKQVFDFLNQA